MYNPHLTYCYTGLPSTNWRTLYTHKQRTSLRVQPTPHILLQRLAKHQLGTLYVYINSGHHYTHNPHLIYSSTGLPSTNWESCIYITVDLITCTTHISHTPELVCQAPTGQDILHRETLSQHYHMMYNPHIIHSSTGMPTWTWHGHVAKTMKFDQKFEASHPLLSLVWKLTHILKLPTRLVNFTHWQFNAQTNYGITIVDFYTKCSKIQCS